MSGKLCIWGDPKIDEAAHLQESRQDHSKYVVKVITFQHQGLRYFASSGWDQRVKIYCSAHDPSRVSLPKAPSATFTCQTNPECLMFAVHPDTDQLHLIVSRRDSTYLLFYAIMPDLSALPSASSQDMAQEQPDQTPRSIPIDCTYAGRQNLAPHSNAWISFTPSHFLSHPTDPTRIAIATSHTPHMKLLIVRLLFPSAFESIGLTVTNMSHQAAQAQADIARQNIEDTAIVLHTSTQAPQTPYSTPQLAWRPDGNGVWVNGDDGVVRGIDVSSGKVVQILGGPASETEASVDGDRGHEAGSKIRSLWAGRLRYDDGHEEAESNEEEVVVSGGFDKRLILWRIPP